MAYYDLISFSEKVQRFISNDHIEAPSVSLSTSRINNFHKHIYDCPLLLFIALSLFQGTKSFFIWIHVTPVNANAPKIIILCLQAVSASNCLYRTQLSPLS